MRTLADYIQIYVNEVKTHCDATNNANPRLANSSYDKARDALREIIKYGDTGREELLRLFEHEDVGVQLWAAADSLKYNERLALIVLKRIASEKIKLISFEAKMIIAEWEKGELDVQ